MAKITVRASLLSPLAGKPTKGAPGTAYLCVTMIRPNRGVAKTSHMAEFLSPSFSYDRVLRPNAAIKLIYL